MSRKFRTSLGLVVAGLTLVSTHSVFADVSIIGHYTFVTGDTATRASYFSRRRIRVQSPDNQEIMYDSKTRHVTVIDNGRRLYWEGPVALADTIVDGLTAHHWALLASAETGEQKADWLNTVERVNDFTHVGESMAKRRIAGYPCDQWFVDAGPYLHLERWVARSLVVEHYDQETEKVATGAVLDPLGRAMMAMFWETRTVPGLPLGASMSFGTPDHRSSFNWEAVKVVGGPIPVAAWEVPPGYTKVDLAILLRED